ncbi:MAG: zinc ABC transporter substrate-binding protein, partial [Thaumarchaeota archaeon]|nr:zinc ABC transporter substrate-binding protein [Nitrososphaerota archaeon]
MGKKGNGFVMRAAIIIGILVVAVGAGLYLTRGSTASSTSTSNAGSNGTIQVVAAENFWGNLASQLGGTHVNVTSIVSDPNTDPHEYQSNPANAIAMAGAKLIIVNGAGYDTWAQTLIGASNTPGQTILNVQNVIGLAGKSDLNPHFWYSPYYVNDTAHAIYKDLIAIDPTDTTYFHSQYAVLNSSLWTGYMKGEAAINRQFGGAPVAATEDIFVYMANATGLKVVSPPAFMQAVA